MCFVILIRLQDARTIRKIVSIDEHTVLAFAGLTADARVLINKVRVEAQSYRLTMEDSPTVEYMARYLAKVQQKYTQQGGVRPFGIATLLAGINIPQTVQEKTLGARPYLYQTDPAGTQSRWKAQVIGGRNAKSLREFLEKQYAELTKSSGDGTEEKVELTEAQCLRLAVQALLEVVDSGAKTMEVCVIRRGGIKEMLSEAFVTNVVTELEQEQQEQQQAAATAASDS